MALGTDQVRATGTVPARALANAEPRHAKQHLSFATVLLSTYTLFRSRSLCGRVYSPNSFYNSAPEPNGQLPQVAIQFYRRSARAIAH
jgi:hypothetical protein